MNEIKDKTQLESIESMRMKNMKRREAAIFLSEAKKIKQIQPALENLEYNFERLEKIKHLDRCRRIIAYNTLKSW